MTYSSTSSLGSEIRIAKILDCDISERLGQRVRGRINVAYGSEDEGRKQRDSQGTIALARPYRQSCTPGIPDSLFDLTPNVPRIQSIGKVFEDRL